VPNEIPFGALCLLRAGSRPAGESAGLRNDADSRSSSQFTNLIISWPGSVAGALLIAVVGVDIKAENGVDFDGLSAAHGWTEFPSG
jgi:hypothetical protein